MKKTRKLIPALVMLVISAVLMSTASFAWFSMNRSVTASGMSVTAKTPASLEISNAPTGSSWGYSANGTVTTTGIDPLTLAPAEVTEKGWYYPSTTNTILEDGSAKYPLNNENIATGYWIKSGTINAPAATHALVNNFYLRTNVGTEDTSTEEIKFKATVNITGTSALLPGVEVYVVEEDGTVTKLVQGTATGEWEAPLSTAGSIKLTVIVIYNGENSAIINDNADLKETSVEITFAVAG